MRTKLKNAVKLFMMNVERQEWEIRGIGMISCRSKDSHLGGTTLVVMKNTSGKIKDRLLLRSKVQTDTPYEKINETLIIWSEADNFHLALIFENKHGCNNIWKRICKVQDKDSSQNFTHNQLYDQIDKVVTPSTENIVQVKALIIGCTTSEVKSIRLAHMIKYDNYFGDIMAVFTMCEVMEDTESLFCLFGIVVILLQISSQDVLQVILSNEHVWQVIGCLEYDPLKDIHTKHRNYLTRYARFHEVIPIKDELLLSKIHQTYKVEYIRNEIIPELSVDVSLAVVNMFIHTNKLKIVNSIQDNKDLLGDVIGLVKQESLENSKRRDALHFVEELCGLSICLQVPARDSLFKKLKKLGIFSAISVGIACGDSECRSIAMLLLHHIVFHAPSLFRVHTVNRCGTTAEDDLLINVLISQLVNDPDPELGSESQTTTILRIALDAKIISKPYITPYLTRDFIASFYKHSMYKLVAPLLTAVSDENPINEMDPTTIKLLLIIMEFLCFCVETHRVYARSFVMQYDLIKKVLILCGSKYSFLVLSALKLFRKIIQLQDSFYVTYIINNNLFSPVIDVFMKNKGKNNLVESAILEMFEFIRMHQVKSLGHHLHIQYRTLFQDVEVVKLFKYLKDIYPVIEELDAPYENNKSSFSLSSIDPTLWNKLKCSTDFNDSRMSDMLEGVIMDEDDACKIGEIEISGPVVPKMFRSSDSIRITRSMKVKESSFVAEALMNTDEEHTNNTNDFGDALNGNDLNTVPKERATGLEDNLYLFPEFVETNTDGVVQAHDVAMLVNNLQHKIDLNETEVTEFQGVIGYNYEESVTSRKRVRLN